jgi:hypothetical protein
MDDDAFSISTFESDEFESDDLCADANFENDPDPYFVDISQEDNFKEIAHSLIQR